MKIEQKQTKSNHLGWMYSQDLHMKLEMMKHHLLICQMVIQELLEEEVRNLAGERYSRNKPDDGKYSRGGMNPGSVRLGKEKVPIQVPRVYNNECGVHEPLAMYQQLHSLEIPSESMIKGILAGLSMGNYGGVIQELTDSFGLSRSTISQKFIEESTRRVEEFRNRDLSKHAVIALFVDGKYLAKEQVVIVLGITSQGEKIPLGFVHTTTENALSIKQLFQSLLKRGLHYTRGLLCVVDGSKGIEKAIEMVFGKHAVVQRCQWHKRENILSYLPEGLKAEFKRKIDRAYAEETYETARSKLLQIRKELERTNISAARSLDEGLEQTLTLHRLGLTGLFRTSFSTTNCIENLNLGIARYLKNVKNWKSSSQRERWVTVALLEIETRFKKVHNYKKLSVLMTAIEQEVEKQKRRNISAA